MARERWALLAGVLCLSFVIGLYLFGPFGGERSAGPTPPEQTQGVTSTAATRPVATASTKSTSSGPTPRTKGSVSKGSSSPRTSTSSTSAPTTTARSRGLDAGLREDLEAVATRYAGDHLGIALQPVGAGEPVVIGADESEVAWSTMKVPLAVAALRGPGGSSGEGDVRQAITVSDNAAAMRLWAGLGGPEQAGRAVESVLRDAGDPATRVQTQVTAPGFTPFGQTRWGLRDQARFTAGVGCLADASPVTSSMAQVVPSQRWGAGRLEGARVKGGWGPTPRGYVLRQLAIVPDATAGGTTTSGTAVTMSVRTTGGMGRATAVADEVGAVLREHRTQLPKGGCT